MNNLILFDPTARMRRKRRIAQTIQRNSFAVMKWRSLASTTQFAASTQRESRCDKKADRGREKWIQSQRLCVLGTRESADTGAALRRSGALLWAIALASALGILLFTGSVGDGFFAQVGGALGDGT